MRDSMCALACRVLKTKMFGCTLIDGSGNSVAFILNLGIEHDSAPVHSG